LESLLVAEITGTAFDALYLAVYAFCMPVALPQHNGIDNAPEVFFDGLGRFERIMPWKILKISTTQGTMCMQKILHHWKKALSVLAVLLTACGGGNPAEEDGQHGFVDTAGRLVVSNAGRQVHVLDVAQGHVIQSYPIDGYATAIHASPDKRYALVMQGGLIQFLDGGIYQEARPNGPMEDHNKAPALLSPRLYAHYYAAHNGLGAGFFNGDSRFDVGPVSMTVFSDKSIGENAPALASLRLNHLVDWVSGGMAEPRGDWLLATWHADGVENKNVPSHVELYERRATELHHVRRFTPECLMPYSSHSYASDTVFVCADGVLVVRQTGNDFTAHKINNPPDVRAGGLGTLIGHDSMGRFVSSLSTGTGDSAVFEINTEANTITRIEEIGNGVQGFHASAIDAEGKNALLLDGEGTLHVWATNGWYKRAEFPKLIPVMPIFGLAASDTRAQIAVSAQEGKAWVSDPRGRSLHTIDIEALQLRDPITLNFMPDKMVWVGIAKHGH